MSMRFGARTIRDASLGSSTLVPPGVSRILGQDRSCRVFNSAVQSISNATETAVTFDSERWDTDNMHSTTANTSRLTAVTAGKYFILANVGFAQNGTGIRFLRLRLNGNEALPIAGVYVPASADINSDHRMFVATYYNMALNDFVEVIIYQDSGGALNTLQNAQESPEFMMIKFPF